MGGMSPLACTTCGRLPQHSTWTGCLVDLSDAIAEAGALVPPRDRPAALAKLRGLLADLQMAAGRRR